MQSITFFDIIIYTDFKIFANLSTNNAFLNVKDEKSDLVFGYFKIRRFLNCQDIQVTN